MLYGYTTAYSSVKWGRAMNLFFPLFFNTALQLQLGLLAILIIIATARWNCDSAV